MLFVNNITMKHGINRQRLDPVLAPDQFGVAKCLGPEDLDRHVTRHGIYPAFPAPTGAPWSEYVRSQMNRSRSVSSSTATLDSDHVGAGHILGEGTTIFTNMTKTMLAALDKHMALCDTVQEPVGSSLNNYLASVPISRQSEIRQEVPDINASRPNTSSISMQGPKTILISSTKREDKYPDLYLPVTENYRISHKFYGYTYSTLVDNNPMILVELTGLAYRYGPTIYAIDRVNVTRYGRFSRGFRMISERATIEPQYRDVPLAGMHGPVQLMCMSTLSGITQMATPLAKSTPVT